MSAYRLVIMCVLIVLFGAVSECEAARRSRHHHSGRSSSVARYQRAVRTQQQQYQRAYAYNQRLIIERQKQMAKQREAELTLRRLSAQKKREKEDELREKRKEALIKLRFEHEAKDREAGFEHGSSEELLHNYDKDGDGALSIEEVGNSPTSKKFEGADINKDGRLTIDELRAASLKP